MKCSVKTCSQTVQVTSALQRMFPLSFYIDIHSINVSVYLCNCKQIATAYLTSHGLCTYILQLEQYIFVHWCLYVYTVQYFIRHDTGTRNDVDVNGKPTVLKSTRMMSFSLYVVSSQHWAYLWLAYSLYCIVSLPCFCLLQVY